MAYTLDTALALDTAGLTLSAQLVDTAGANVGSAVSTGFSDLGLGFYLWHYTGFPDGFRGAVKFSAAGAVKAVAAINPEEGENTDVKTSTRTTLNVGALSVNYVGPVVDDGVIKLVRGDDYALADGRAIDVLERGAWPVLTGATVALKTESHATHAIFTKAGTVVTATGSPKAVRFEPTAAETAALAIGVHDFDIEATLSSGRVATLGQGLMHVLADVR